ncbi:MAG TPA: hypothetical protein ENI27_10560 [bacterium]|nr:hypothetical protein [bacterium]
MRKKRVGERIDWVHLVVTVLPERNTYKVVKFPPALFANQFCYAFRVEIKLEDWLERITEVKLPLVTPPGAPPLMAIIREPMESFAGVTEQIPKSYGEQMIDRLDGQDDPGDVSEKRIEIE